MARPWQVARCAKSVDDLNAIHGTRPKRLFALQRLMRWPQRCFDAQGDLVGDADAVAFQGYYLFWMVGQDTDVS